MALMTVAIFVNAFVLVIAMIAVARVASPDAAPESKQYWRKNRARYELVFTVLPFVIAVAFGYFVIWPLGDVLLAAFPWPWQRLATSLGTLIILLEISRRFRSARLHSWKANAGHSTEEEPPHETQRSMEDGHTE